VRAATSESGTFPTLRTTQTMSVHGDGVDIRSFECDLCRCTEKVTVEIH
jgi:hypothetical protein